MRYITKIMTPVILAVSLVAIAGCDSPSQAQLASTQIETTSQTPVSSTQTARPDVHVWVVDVGASHLKFSALQEGEPFEGAFKTFTADIKFHPDNLAASSVTVTVPISGADAGSTDRNSTLPGKAWFSAKKFPDAVFTATTFKSMGEGAYDAVGELTIKGDTAVMSAALEMNRNDWNIGAKPWNTDEYVSTGVKLDILVTANVAN